MIAYFSENRGEISVVQENLRVNRTTKEMERRAFISLMNPEIVFSGLLKLLLKFWAVQED